MNQPNERTLARMRKLLALARQGVGGEAENAERFLRKTLAAHGMTMDDLAAGEEVRSRVTLTYSTDFERKLTIQVLAKVLNGIDGRPIYTRGRKKLYAVDLTPAEHAEVVMHIDILKPVLKRHMDIAFNAFVQANRLYRERREDDCADGDMDDDEAARLLSMMAACERVDVHKAIELTA